MRWPEFWQRYEEDRRSLGRSEGTLRGYARAVHRFAAFVGERAPCIQDVHSEHLDAYQAHLESLSSLSASGVHHELRAVWVALRWAARHGWLLLDPTAGMVLSRPVFRQMPLFNEREVAALLEAPSHVSPQGLRDRAMLELFYGTGLRHSEVLALDLADLDLTGRHLTVRRGKGGRPRRVPLGSHLCQVLMVYLERGRPLLCPNLQESALFVSTRGLRWGMTAVNQMVKRYASQQGLAPHALRRAFATHLLERGARLEHVKDLLGHRWIGSTEDYCEVQAASLERELRRTHPRARRPRARKAKKKP